MYVVIKDIGSTMATRVLAGGPQIWLLLSILTVVKHTARVHGDVVFISYNEPPSPATKQMTIALSFWLVHSILS